MVPNKFSTIVCLPVNVHWCKCVIQGPDKWAIFSVERFLAQGLHLRNLSYIVEIWLWPTTPNTAENETYNILLLSLPNKTSCHKEMMRGLVCASWNWTAMLVTSNSMWEVYCISSISWFSSLAISLMHLEYSLKATQSFRSGAECLASSRSSWWHSSYKRDQRWKKTPRVMWRLGRLTWKHTQVLNSELEFSVQCTPLPGSRGCQIGRTSWHCYEIWPAWSLLCQPFETQVAWRDLSVCGSTLHSPWSLEVFGNNAAPKATVVSY